VILPSKTLKNKYENFFDEANLPGRSRQNIKIFTAEERRYFDPGTHIFVDEFCATVTKSETFLHNFQNLINMSWAKIKDFRAFFQDVKVLWADAEDKQTFFPQLEDLMKEKKFPEFFQERFIPEFELWTETGDIEWVSKSELLFVRSIWITLDFKQHIRNTWTESYDAHSILENEQFSKTYLGMIHRCTHEVLKSYRHYCGPLIDTSCHQYKGIKTKPVRLSSGNILEKLVETKKEINREDYKDKDIAIIFVPTHPYIMFIYFEMKKQAFPNVYLENETLSHEWSVVIVCQSAIDEELAETTAYIAFSRAVFKLGPML
jgi:hypothetical protein